MSKSKKISIQELFLSDTLRLPIIQTDKNLTFREHLYGAFKKYEEALDKLSPKGLGFISFAAEKKTVHYLVKDIKDAIDAYLNGYPASAYSYIDDAKYLPKIISILGSGNYPKSTQFYRLRLDEDNFSKKKTELFHIAFDIRGKVATQRYSIPGFPCLYLANSIYVAWEELRRKPLSQLQAARFASQKKIKFLDLVTETYNLDSTSINKIGADMLWNYLLCWPLIAACSVKVVDDKASFKPEYIIPQLLLQKVRNDGKLDGIRFSSTHININEVKSKGKFHNLVIPVKDRKDKGHCDSMNALFKMTDVVSWQLLDAAVGIKKWPANKTNLNVDSIEIIKGGVHEYELSPFSTMEKYLNLELKEEHVF